MQDQPTAEAAVKESLPLRLPRHFGIISKAANARTVGLVRPCYGLEKVSYGLPLTRYRHCRVQQVPIDKFEKHGTFLSYTPAIADNSLPLLHTWNQLPVSRHRFVVSFENELPRYLNHPSRWQMQFGLGRLRSRSCRSILALSEAAFAATKKRMLDTGEHEVASKIMLFRGGVAPSAFSRPRNFPSGPLRLLFVGADAFRKGLVPCFEAIEQLRRGGIEAELTVVGDVTCDSYVMRNQSVDRELWRQKLSETPWVSWFKKQSNAQVRQAMSEHHLLLLPSLDETLGWVVIEAAMEGRASIVSNVFAFEELVRDGQSGSVIPLPRREDRRWAGLEKTGSDLDEHIFSAYELIRVGLIRELSHLAGNRDLIQQRGAAALAHLGPLYDAKAAAEKIESIYDQALA